ncbi:MAG: DNA mismatch repair endonuclease MutL [Firmicutes bacterium]|nr:DNA mismatch repair endonuclease MutL [Bacillota bacterium]
MIKILDKRTADKIAAGEVIDRPVSIIKELVENSIDAGATSITVEISNGGKSYIRVTDNGCGIPADEVELAFKRHATSKISDVSDLDSIYTLGFRGEALASICAVARVEVMTKTEDAKAGRRVIVEGSNILENAGFGCPVGTTITVRDLFYNIPARLKFLASDAAEARRIIDMISKIALSYPDIRFKMINGNKHVFTTTGKGIILNNIVNIYGADLSKDLIAVDKKTDRFSIKGFVSNPAYSLTSRIRQIFCVNGRVISSSIIERGLEKAYKERLFQGRFPVAFLFISLPPEEVDVNVHPTKKEIRFDDNAEVEDFVESAVREALARTEAIPSAKIREENIPVSKKQEPQVAKPIEKTRVSEPKFEYKPERKSIPQGEQVDIKKLLSYIRKEEEKKVEPVKPEAEIKQEIKIARPFEPASLNIIGSVFNTYILAYDENCFYMVDQHAAHERVFYEKFKAQYEAIDKVAQQLLIPLNFNVPSDVVTMEDSWLPKVIQMGYSIEYFGNNTYMVREVPSFMTPYEAESFLRTLFTEFKGGKLPDNQKLLDRIIMNSCKAAIKGGDNISLDEMNALMMQLSACENPFSCPHGRPVFVKMTQYEIEKMFKRVQ